MSATSRERRGSLPAPPSDRSAPSPPEGTPAAKPKEAKPEPKGSVPFLLDFFPLQGPEQTRLARFFDRLKEGVLTTTRCTNCGAVHWPPRVACPECHSEALEWIALPQEGTVYAWSAVLGGAPSGMEKDVPFAVGLVDLEGSPLRIFGRIEGKPWADLRIGDRVQVEPFQMPDGRSFYRFRVA